MTDVAVKVSTWARADNRGDIWTGGSHSVLAEENAAIVGRRGAWPKQRCIIYGVLSPIGPSVMAVLCPIKIMAGAPRRYTPEIKSLHVELIYFRIFGSAARPLWIRPYSPR